MTDRNFIVTIEVRTTYTIPVIATCGVKAEKIARNTDTESICRIYGTFVKMDHEVTKVEENK